MKIQVRNQNGTEEYKWESFNEFLDETMSFKSKFSNLFSNIVSSLYNDCINNEKSSSEEVRKDTIYTLYLKK